MSDVGTAEGRMIHVALASDSRGAQGLAVVIHSLLGRASRPVCLWVIESRMSARLKRRLADVVGRASPTARIEFVAETSLPLSAPAWWRGRRWPLIACARFQLADVLPAEARRCVYLDIDMLVGVDLAALFDADLQGLPVGMVANTGMSATDADYVRSLGLDPARYCNSGMLLMDLEAWREERAGRRLLEHGKAMRPDLWFFDQDMLNDYFAGRCMLLDERWNRRDAAADPEGSILHFAGAPKPWNTRADDVHSRGLVAWHAAKAESGFEPMPANRIDDARDWIGYVGAKAQRAVRRWLRRAA